MGIEPCENLNQKLEKHVSGLEDIESKASGYVSASKNKLGSFNKVPTDTDEIKNKVKDLTPSAAGAGNEAQKLARKFTGSCFDDVLKSASSWGENAKSALGDVLDKIPSFSGLPENDLAKSLQNLKGILAGFNIPNLLAELDRLLGCLSDQTDLAECTSKLQNAMDRTDAVLNSLHLTEDGIFSEDKILDSVPSLDNKVKDNLKVISSKMDETEVEVIKNVKELKPPKTKTDFKLF
jgi:hypothetical protein